MPFRSLRVRIRKHFTGAMIAAVAVAFSKPVRAFLVVVLRAEAGGVDALSPD